LHSIVQWKVASLEPKSATVYDAGFTLNYTGTKSINVVASIKCGYWNTARICWIDLILAFFYLENCICPKIDCYSLETTRCCTLCRAKNTPTRSLLAIFINNYFVEKVEAPVVFFSVYGFLWSFVIQYKLEKSSCSLLRRVFNDEIND
jgi:hypothetical protein